MKQHKIGLGIAFGVALGVVAPVLAQQAVQWRVEDGGNGHWYACVTSEMGYAKSEAIRYAAIHGGHLFTGCNAEFDFVVAATGALASAAWRPDEGALAGPWIGLVRNGAGLSWVDATTCAFDRWDDAPQQPDAWGEDGVALFTIGQQPQAKCHDIWGFRRTGSLLIEWSADCNADGIVDYGQCRDGSLADYDGNNIPDCCESGMPCAVGTYPVQWRVEDGGNGHWYIVDTNTTADTGFNRARELALGLGGDLAGIQSAAESEFVRKLSYSSYWIGGIQPAGSAEPNGGWQWVNGDPWTYTNWLPNEPNNLGGSENFIAVNPDGRWNDGEESSNFPRFAIEWSADCNGDGIVDYGQILDGTFEDSNSNGVPDICEVDPCPGDINESGVVNGIDLAAILAYWGTDGGKFPRTDANDDGTVDANDLAIVLSGWGNCP